MDRLLFESLAERFKLGSGFDVLSDAKAKARLLEAAEMAKIELSSNTSAHISLPFIGVVGNEQKHLELDLTRSELERIVHPIIERCRQPVERALADANLQRSQIDRLIFVGGPTRMPVVRAFFEELLGRKGETGVDPMECVAAGAAIQAGVLEGQVGDIVLVDVTPLTLGVETLGGVATSLIPRNTPIPVKKSDIFTTAADMQTSVTIHVYQGERPMSRDNTSLGEFNLDGLVPAPRGVPKIEVTFDLDASGIMDVTAKDTATGKAQSIRISGSTRLPEAEKQRMMKEAEQFAAEDKKRREEIEKLNNADAICYQGERFLADFGAKIDVAQKTFIGNEIHEIKTALSAKNADAAATHADKLKNILQEAGRTIYAQATPAAAAAQPAGETPQARVVDAEYAETKK
jgi:molecular chaperone DnaK